jgi:hypothetical protein
VHTETMIQLAGGLQLLQTPAILAGQRSLGWLAELQALTALGRRFVYAIAAGVFCYVTGSGILTLFMAKSIATSPLGFALCALQAVAWSVRASQQFVSMAPVWPKRGRWLHFAMEGVYSFLAILYWVVCVDLAIATWS